VIVIGTSTAGLFAAYLLASEGVPVQVYEQSEILDPLARTLIVTSEMNRVLGFVPGEAIVNKVNAFTLISSGTSTRVGVAEPDLIVERDKFIRALTHQARQAGAEIHFGYRFLGLEQDSDSLLLTLANRAQGKSEHVRTRTLIGADGARSQVARAISRNSLATVPTLQAQVALPAGADPSTVQVWFERGRTRFFYWLIPESAERAAVGLIAEDASHARERLDGFLSAQRLEPLSYQAGQVPLYDWRLQPWRKIGASSVFLVGDAAGQVKVTTVGGVVTGLKGARAAAQAIVRRSNYARELSGVKRELTLHHMLRHILDRFADSDYDQLLTGLNRGATRILQMHNRDEMARVFWRLLLAQPRWLSLAARALLRSF